MFKKVLKFAIAFSLCTASSFAGSPYVGANIGQAYNNVSVQNGISNTHYGYSGLVGGVFAGYGAFLTKRFSLSGEIFLNDSTARSASKTISGTGIPSANLITSYSFGVSILPGILLGTSTLVYARLGLAFTHFELNPGTTVVFKSVSRIPTGGQLGLGLQYAFRPTLHIRGEYVHTSYRSFDALGNSLSPTNSMLTVGLVYYLG